MTTAPYQSCQSCIQRFASKPASTRTREKGSAQRFQYQFSRFVVKIDVYGYRNYTYGTLRQIFSHRDSPSQCVEVVIDLQRCLGENNFSSSSTSLSQSSTTVLCPVKENHFGSSSTETVHIYTLLQVSLVFMASSTIGHLGTRFCRALRKECVLPRIKITPERYKRLPRLP